MKLFDPRWWNHHAVHYEVQEQLRQLEERTSVIKPAEGILEQIKRGECHSD